jgi:chromosomal replication initiator protein
MVAPEAPPFAQLFLHGPCGVGKTHLLDGICHAVGAAKRPGGPLRWRYVTGEQFTNEFVTALRKRDGEAFRARYRNLDLLAIDDVHFLAAKKATQEEFLHTFNAIQGAGKRVVMASDAHPHMVGDLSEQLTSRFVAGMVVRVDPPEESLRERILRRKLQAMNLRVEEAVVDYVVRHVRGSVRELEGAVLKLTALSALDAGPITLATAQSALADQMARTDCAITLGEIESQVAAFFGVTPADLHSSRRTRTVSNARMLAMFLARRHTSMSYPEIARAMGKNHSTVVLAVQRMEKRLADGGDIAWNSPAGARSIPAGELVEMLTRQID